MRAYAVSQETARTCAMQGRTGFPYESVRDHGGECAAIFRLRLVSNCCQKRHLCYVWEGCAISTVYEKRMLET